MDITEVGNEWGNYDEWNEEWTDQWQAGDIDAFGKSKGKGMKGKGKGKGKSGFQGQCYNCGQMGHSAKFCPQGGKSKGKGGKDTRQCYNCGQFGHLAWQCTKGLGKAGNPGAGIKGKGQTWELANVNPEQVDGNAQATGIEDAAPMWQPGNHEDINLGGNWDNSIGMIADNDDDWRVVMR